MNIDLSITTKQEAFINSCVDETLFGGAAGRGKVIWTINRCFIICVKISKKQTTNIKTNISRARKIFN